MKLSFKNLAAACATLVCLCSSAYAGQLCEGYPCTVRRPAPELAGRLETLLNGFNEVGRAAAAEELGRSGSGDVFPALVYAGAHDAFYEVRAAARKAAELLKPAAAPEDTEHAVMLMKLLLAESNWANSRCGAALALEKLGCAAVPAIPVLRQRLYFAETDNAARDRMFITEHRVCSACDCPAYSLGDYSALQMALSLDLPCPEDRRP